MVLADVHCMFVRYKANMNHYDTTTVFYSQSRSLYLFTLFISIFYAFPLSARTSSMRRFRWSSREIFQCIIFKTNSERNFINAINRDLLRHQDGFIQSCDKQLRHYSCIKCKCRYVKNILALTRWTSTEEEHFSKKKLELEVDGWESEMEILRRKIWKHK